jgi:hypothetical protein
MIVHDCSLNFMPLSVGPISGGRFEKLQLASHRRLRVVTKLGHDVIRGRNVTIDDALAVQIGPPVRHAKKSIFLVFETKQKTIQMQTYF